MLKKGVRLPDLIYTDFVAKMFVYSNSFETTDKVFVDIFVWQKTLDSKKTHPLL